MCLRVELTPAIIHFQAADNSSARLHVSPFDIFWEPTDDVG